ncbi:PucR family transcriptional regulator [Gorillibacterium sp. sgz5001074]|uniref:PucR family transcriptional regulator n=1 Tax=Gorillibacterium sp. sgz5001074 TaxID=3446695 RepID=UPI003F67959B
METEFKLTVAEVLQRPLFQGVRILAGEKGLNRRVRWVHIVEVSHFEMLMDGGELVLTTGIAFSREVGFSVRYLEQLIQQHAACLCIELGHSLFEVPDQLIEAANAHDFPLLVFPGAVRFVDITQDLHSLIINRHHRMLQELEIISRKFHHLSLGSQGLAGVLKLLQVSTGNQVAYVPVQGAPSFVPVLPAARQKELLEAVTRCVGERQGTAGGSDTFPYHSSHGEWSVMLQPVRALGRIWGYVAMAMKDRLPQEFDSLILDSASLWAAQDLLRKRYVEERRMYTENLWVEDLLNGRLRDEEELKSLLGVHYKRLHGAGCQVCVVEFEHRGDLEAEGGEEGAESIGIHLSLLLRSRLEQASFHPLMTVKNNRLVIVAADLYPKSPAKGRLGHILGQLLDGKEEELLQQVKLTAGVGKPQARLMNAPASYQEAVQAMTLHPCMGKSVLFFDDLGVYQLIFQVSDRERLQAFVNRYLGPLIEHDAQKGGELLLTLKVYLDYDGSKQMASKKLYIVRQSLYYRLDKIAELLGPGYMETENRLALQVALRAYQLLHADDSES